MAQHALSVHDVVEASEENITHKMVKRACKGRWCTKNTRAKVRHALENASGESYALEQLFTY